MDSMTIRVVTIDGPAGAGKSTISKQLAERLNWRLLDTGAMFRAVTWAAIREGLDLEDSAGLDELVDRIRLRFEGSRIWLDEREISGEIRSHDVTSRTKFAANHPKVRSRLKDWQREYARTHSPLIAEGRDQGTIVFPDAVLKIFLTASPQERAKRRHAEFLARGEAIPFEEVLSDLIRRDGEDEVRRIAPLKPAPDAQFVDTTGLDPEQVLTKLERLVLDALAQR